MGRVNDNTALMATLDCIVFEQARRTVAELMEVERILPFHPCGTAREMLYSDPN